MAINENSKRIYLSEETYNKMDFIKKTLKKKSMNEVIAYLLDM